MSRRVYLNLSVIDESSNEFTSGMIASSDDAHAQNLSNRLRVAVYHNDNVSWHIKTHTHTHTHTHT